MTCVVLLRQIRSAMEPVAMGNVSIQCVVLMEQHSYAMERAVGEYVWRICVVHLRVIWCATVQSAVTVSVSEQSVVRIKL